MKIKIVVRLQNIVNQSNILGDLLDNGDDIGPAHLKNNTIHMNVFDWTLLQKVLMIQIHQSINCNTLLQLLRIIQLIMTW